MTMSARLDRPITLQKPTTVKDAHGIATITWTDYEDYAQLKGQTGAEYYSDGKIASIDAVFIIRYRPDVDETWRIIYNGNTYEIVSPPIEVGRFDMLRFSARRLR